MTKIRIKWTFDLLKFDLSSCKTQLDVASNRQKVNHFRHMRPIHHSGWPSIHPSVNQHASSAPATVGDTLPNRTIAFTLIWSLHTFKPILNIHSHWSEMNELPKSVSTDYGSSKKMISFNKGVSQRQHSEKQWLLSLKNEYLSRTWRSPIRWRLRNSPRLGV